MKLSIATVAVPLATGFRSCVFVANAIQPRKVAALIRSSGIIAGQCGLTPTYHAHAP
jgi:hypothetical protein